MKFSPELPRQNPKRERRIDPRQQEIDRLKGQQVGDREASERLRELVREIQEESRRQGRQQAPRGAQLGTSTSTVKPTELPKPSSGDLFPKHERNDQPNPKRTG